MKIFNFLAKYIPLKYIKKYQDIIFISDKVVTKGNTCGQRSVSNLYTACKFDKLFLL